MSVPEESTETPARQLQTALIEYIREKWGDVLGHHIALLDEEDGLDRLWVLLRSGALEETPSPDSKSPFFSI